VAENRDVHIEQGLKSVHRENSQRRVEAKGNLPPLGVCLADRVAQSLILHMEIAIMGGEGDKEFAFLFDDPADYAFGFKDGVLGHGGQAPQLRLQDTQPRSSSVIR